MRKRMMKGAPVGRYGSSLRNLNAIEIKAEGTSGQHNRNNADLRSTLTGGMIFVTSRKTGRRLGGLLSYTRRLIAMPFMAFSICAFNRTHGVSLPKTLTGTPYGNSKELLFPCVQSANLYGVAHPLGGGVGFTTDNPNTRRKP